MGVLLPILLVITAVAASAYVIVRRRSGERPKPVEEMALEAARLGHEYLAITDHSPRLRVANGLDSGRRLAQLDHIAALNDALGGTLRVLGGAEVDILDDGSLDGEPAVLDRLDLVVASVHSKLAMDADAMTHRELHPVAVDHLQRLPLRVHAVRIQYGAAAEDGALGGFCFRSNDQLRLEHPGGIAVGLGFLLCIDQEQCH